MCNLKCVSSPSFHFTLLLLCHLNCVIRNVYFEVLLLFHRGVNIDIRHNSVGSNNRRINIGNDSRIMLVIMVA